VLKRTYHLQHTFFLQSWRKRYRVKAEICSNRAGFQNNINRNSNFDESELIRILANIPGYFSFSASRFPGCSFSLPFLIKLSASTLLPRCHYLSTHGSSYFRYALTRRAILPRFSGSQRERNGLVTILF